MTIEIIKQVDKIPKERIPKLRKKYNWNQQRPQSDFQILFDPEENPTKELVKK